MPRCNACPKDLSTTKAGDIRRHDRDIWLGGPNYRTEPCPGSGKAPCGIATQPLRELRAAVAGGKTARVAAEAATIRASLAPAAAGTAPRGAMDAQRRAYAKVGLPWTPEAIRKQSARHRRI